MFFNQGNGTFIEDIQSKVSHSSFFSMGCDAADINNDGLVDLAVLDMTPSDHYRNKTLMESMDVNKFSYLTNQKGYVPQYMFNTLNLNRSKGHFSEIGHFLGVAQTDWSWAALLVDFDNNSWKDLMVTNGFKRDTRNRDWMNELEVRYETEGVTGAVLYDQLQKSNSTPLLTKRKSMTWPHGAGTPTHPEAPSVPCSTPGTLCSGRGTWAPPFETFRPGAG